MNEQNNDDIMALALENYQAKRAALLLANEATAKANWAHSEAITKLRKAREECDTAWRELLKDYQQNGGHAQ